MQSQDILEREIQNAKDLIKLNQALKELRTNRNFKHLILENFFEKEPARLVTLMASPQYQQSEKQATLFKEMQAISGLHSYFLTVQQMAAVAEKQLLDMEEELNTLREGDDNE